MKSRQTFFLLLVTLALTVTIAPDVGATGCTPGTNCTASGGTPPQTAPAFGEAHAALSSGLFEYSKTDLTIGGVLPIEIARVYRSEDRDVNNHFIVRDFGWGTSFNYGLYLYSTAEVNGQSNPFAAISVVMPDGAQLKCVCSVNNACNGNSPPSTSLVCGLNQPAGIWVGSTLSYVSGTPATWNLVCKDATTYTFGAGAPLQQITDRLGNSIAISRSSGQVTSVSSSSGRYVNFAYSGGTVSSITDNTGRVVNYHYNTNKALTDVYYSSDNPTHPPHTQYTYNSSYQGDIHDVILDVSASLSLKNNNYVTYEGGAKHRVATLAPNTGNGQAYSYTYDLDPSKTYVQENEVTLPDGAAEWFFFDANGYLTKEERAPTTFGEITAYTRDVTTDHVTQIQQEDSNQNVLRTTAYQYSADNYQDITQIMVTPGPGSAANATTIYGFQTATLVNGLVLDELMNVTDPLLQKTTYGYDAAGNVNSVTDPTNTRTWSYTYYSNGEVHTAIDPKHNPATVYVYNSYGDPYTITDPNNHTTTYGTDGLGRITSVKSPLGNTTQFTYDPIDDLISVIDPNGNITSMTYDLLGEIASRTDPRGNTTTFTRPNTLNQLKVCDTLNKCTVTNYDAGAKMSDSTDPNQVKTMIS